MASITWSNACYFEVPVVKAWYGPTTALRQCLNKLIICCKWVNPISVLHNLKFLFFGQSHPCQSIEWKHQLKEHYLSSCSTHQKFLQRKRNNVYIIVVFCLKRFQITCFSISSILNTLILVESSTNSPPLSSFEESKRNLVIAVFCYACFLYSFWASVLFPWRSEKRLDFLRAITDCT